MTSHAKAGVLLAINGLAIAALAGALLADGADLQAAASRAYLTAMLLAPIAIVIVLAVPQMRRGAVLCLAMSAAAALLVGSFGLPAGTSGPAVTAAVQQSAPTP